MGAGRKKQLNKIMSEERMFKKKNRIALGILLCVLAFFFITLGGGVTWGITGALWAGGITLAVFGFVCFISAHEDICND